MPSKLKWITIPLHLSAVAYVIVALFSALAFLGFPVMLEGSPDYEVAIMVVTMVLMVVLSVGMIIFIELVVAHLKKGKFWAWVAAICLAGLYIPSLYFPMGIFMIIGLVNEEVKEFCSKKKSIVEGGQ